MIVLLDCDGILCNFIGGVLDVVQYVTGTRHEYEEIDQWDFWPCLNLDPTDKFAVDVYLKSCGFCSKLRPMPGAREAVAELQKRCEVYCVTVPYHGNKTWCHERTEWLWREVGIPASQIIFTESKHMVRGNVLIDDKPDNLSSWSYSEEGNSLCVLWNRPWNEGAQVNAVKVDNWDEVRALI